MIATIRLPAYGKQVRANIDSGRRPLAGGGAVIVTTRWNYAKGFVRLVCEPYESATRWDLRFLRGCEVVVLVPECDRAVGEQLTQCVRGAGAKLVVLSVVEEAQT